MLISPRHIPKLILATAFAPLVVKNAKPIVKAAGKGLVKVGEFVEKLADELESNKSAVPPVAEPMHVESAPAEEASAPKDEPEQPQDSPVGEPPRPSAVVDEAVEFVEPDEDAVIEPEVVGTEEGSDAPNEA